MALSPTPKAMGPDAVFDATVVPFTVIDAVLSAAVGVTVMELVALLTLAV